MNGRTIRQAFVGTVLVLVMIGLLGCGTKSPVVGEYINPMDLDDCLEINKDGTCYMEMYRSGETGRWKLENERIHLLFSYGETYRCIVKTDAILLDWNELLVAPRVWIKPTKSPPTVVDVAGRYVKENHSDEYLMLNAYATFTQIERANVGGLITKSGKWELDGHTVLLHIEYWGTAPSDTTLSAAWLENRIYFGGLNGRDVWIGEPR